jgi:hypothetical protein
MGPGARIHRPKDPDRHNSICKDFFLVARTTTRRLHESRWVDRDAVLHGSNSTDFRHWFVVEHGEMARRAPPNNNVCFFLHAATTVSCILQFAAMLIPRSEDCRPLHLRAVRSTARNCGRVCFPASRIRPSQDASLTMLRYHRPTPYFENSPLFTKRDPILSPSLE